MYLRDHGNEVRDAVSISIARFAGTELLVERSPRAVARINRHDDGKLPHQIIAKRFDGYIRHRILGWFDSAGELAMNDATIAADVQAEESKEAHDFVEMGTVSEETRGGVTGNFFDGAFGRWNA